MLGLADEPSAAEGPTKAYSKFSQHLIRSKEKWVQAACLLDAEMSPNHGAAFWRWAHLAMATRLNLPVFLCHHYPIRVPYVWHCRYAAPTCTSDKMIISWKWNGSR